MNSVLTLRDFQNIAPRLLIREFVRGIAVRTYGEDKTTVHTSFKDAWRTNVFLVL
jgi:hypothetical protein